MSEYNRTGTQSNTYLEHIAAIPAELKAIPQWCVFQVVPQPNGKSKKIPLVAGGKDQKAAVDDPRTLRPYEVALRDARTRGTALGFAFTPDLPYFFIDADGVTDLVTDAVRPEIDALIADLDTYTEVSVSGDGVHVIGTGRFPQNPAPYPPQGQPVERYPLRGGRFCLITGEVLEGHEEIKPREATLHRLFPPRPRAEREAGPGVAGALTEAEGNAIVNWAGEHWVDGQRNAMALYLSGVLATSGVPRAQAVRIVERCAWADNDPGAKVQACHGTYDTFEAGEPVMGWQGFVDNVGLSREQIAPLDQIIATFKLRHTVKKNGHAPKPPLAPRTVRMGDVMPERVEWLWMGRLALGKMSVMDGDPGLGKSTVTLDIAARVSTGEPFPGMVGRRPPRGVVLLSAEDGLADTIRPRLEAAGADLTRIVAITGVETPDGVELGVHIPDMLPSIRQVIEQVDAKLLIVDPLMAYFSPSVDSNNDQKVRGALAPLAAMLDETRCAAWLLRHMNKTDTRKTLYRGGGSIGIIGAARFGVVVAEDPDDPFSRVIATTKCNIGPEPPSLRYKLVGVPGTDVARVEWDPHAAPVSAADLLTGAGDDGQGTPDEAAEWLRHFLGPTMGGTPALKVVQEAKRLGFGEKTLRAAKRKLGVISKPSDFGGDWVMVLPGASGD